MSHYQKLNDVKVDFDNYEQQELSELQKKQWGQRVKKKLQRKRYVSKRGIVGFTVAATLALTISINTGIVSLANIPFVGGKIENYLSKTEQYDYSSFKTAIGEAAENEYGKITLNEVLIDGGRLIISSTFEPQSGLGDLEKKLHPLPKVLINGQNLTSETGGEVIKINTSMYTFYTASEIKDIPLGEKVQFNIQYDNLDFEWKVENPWTFDIELSSEMLASQSKTFELNKVVTLENGQQATLDKLVLTPISSVLYYNVNEITDYHIAFLLRDADGQNIPFTSASITEEGSQIRFKVTNTFLGPFTLIPYITSAKQGKESVEYYKELPEKMIIINE